MVMSPEAMAISQKSHRQPAAGVRLPPMMGPMVGPKTGPIKYADMAIPRFSRTIISAMELAPNVAGQEPAMPASKRYTTRDPKLLDTAHATLKMANKKVQDRNMMAFPYISDSGAMTRGPKAYPSR